MEGLPVQIPTSLYVIIGAFLVANVGAIISVFTMIFKAGMFVATTKADIKAAKEIGVRAHKRIDEIDGAPH